MASAVAAAAALQPRCSSLAPVSSRSSRAVPFAGEWRARMLLLLAAAFGSFARLFVCPPVHQLETCGVLLGRALCLVRCEAEVSGASAAAGRRRRRPLVPTTPKPPPPLLPAVACRPSAAAPCWPASRLPAGAGPADRGEVGA